MKPYKIENGVPYFYTSQIDDYGFPEYFGYERYLVVNDNECCFVTDWKMEQERRQRPIHRYNRVARFTFVLAQLLCLKGSIPFEEMNEIRKLATELSWNSIHKVLKELKYRHLYNRIPQILKNMNAPSAIDFECSNGSFREMINDFRILQNEWNKQNNDRKYFPSLRFIALKMLEERGAKIHPEIQFMKTKKKQINLENLWSCITESSM